MQHTAKTKDSITLKKIEERDIIHSIEFSNPYENPTEKNPEIIETIEKKL